MSNLVTFEQAKMLKDLGFDGECLYWYNEVGVKECPIEQGYMEYYYEVDCFLNDWNAKKIDRDLYGSYPPKVPYSVPTVSEALDWIREEKGIDCCAFFNNELFGNLDNAKAIYYFKYGCNGRMIYNSWNVDYKSFDTHSLAESALLDAVLTYLEKK